MSALDIFLIIGCIAVGYWVVRSVMGDGVEMPGQSARPQTAPPGRAGQPSARRGKSPSRYHETAPHAWYLVLDVQPDASAAEIGEAVKRRLARADSAGDRIAMMQVMQAAGQGLKSRPRLRATPQNLNRTPKR